MPETEGAAAGGGAAASAAFTIDERMKIIRTTCEFSSISTLTVAPSKYLLVGDNAFKARDILHAQYEQEILEMAGSITWE